MYNTVPGSEIKRKAEENSEPAMIDHHLSNHKRTKTGRVGLMMEVVREENSRNLRKRKRGRARSVEIEITSWKARAYGIFTQVGEVSESERVRF